MTFEEEQLLEEWIVEMCRRGLPLIRDNLLDSVQHILNEDGRSNLFLIIDQDIVGTDSS